MTANLSEYSISIPREVSVDLGEQELVISGPKGRLAHKLPHLFKLKKSDSSLVLTYSSADKKVRALAGTWRSHIANMFRGVLEGFSKKLIVEGIGYRVRQDGEFLLFELGFSHPIKFPIPRDIAVLISKDSITISGIDRELVGSTAAKIRALRPPDPYKGKGIRYESEVLRLKPGKRAVGAA